MEAKQIKQNKKIVEKYYGHYVTTCVLHHTPTIINIKKWISQMIDTNRLRVFFYLLTQQENSISHTTINYDDIEKEYYASHTILLLAIFAVI